jgi:hypothetical protein
MRCNRIVTVDVDWKALRVGLRRAHKDLRSHFLTVTLRVYDPGCISLSLRN